MYDNIPTHVLIREANGIEGSFIHWSGAEMLIDTELQHRYDEIKEELEEFEAFESLPA